MRTSAAACVSIVAAVVGMATVPATASASQLVDRDGRNVRIAVNGSGEAMVSYTKGAVTKHVLVWGAINALPPTRGKRQVEFQLDYSGNRAKGFVGSCGRYDGPAVPYLVVACKAPDGSYWAVQEWPQPLPDLGYTPWLAPQRTLWMDVSHWRGPLARLTAYPDWVYSGQFHSLFGAFTYHGSPVYGFGTTQYGAPTDGFGRLIFLDTYNSPYSPGWRRENSFVPHNPTGVFCYGFYSFDPTKGGYQHPPGQADPRGPGVGTKYRLIGRGPGVTPDVQAVVNDPGDYDASSQADVEFRLKQWRLLGTFIGSDQQCLAGRALGGAQVSVERSWMSSSSGDISTDSFSIGDNAFFNVRFSHPLNSQSISAIWTTPRGGKFTTRAELESDSLQATASFRLFDGSRNTGRWTVSLVVKGLAVAQASFDVSRSSGSPPSGPGGGSPPGGTAPPTSLPINTAPPQLTTYTPTAGDTIAVSNGSWSGSPTGFRYTWYRCAGLSNQCQVIADATDPSYKTTPTDVGDSFYAIVTAINASGQTNAQPPYRTNVVAAGG